MNKTASFVFVFMFILYPTMTVNARQDKKYYDWFYSQEKIKPIDNSQARILSPIKVKGNKFINGQGDTVILRGVAIADPDKIDQEGHWNKILFEQVKAFGATVVRIPIHPAAWRARTPANYFRLLDQAVDWCTNLGMYIMIDWHSIGNLGMELFQDPMYQTTQQETYEFWRLISAHFRGHNTIAFYEIFNEPTLASGRFGSMSWSQWKNLNENIIHLIRAYDKEKIPLVAGLDWAYDLTPLNIEPIEAEGIGYVTHPYQHKRKPPYEPKWDEDFGFAADRYPVVATEFGLSLGKQSREGSAEYGNAIINYLENKKISWVCWIFDPGWFPRLLASWDTFALTESGEFFRQALLKNKSK
jgi:endoglucanase